MPSRRTKRKTWRSLCICFPSVFTYLIFLRREVLMVSQTIADSSKILTNIGLIHATLGEHELAVEQFIAATQLDQYLAVA